MITENTERSAFIEQNLGLVHSCAGRFRGRGIEYDDLYSAGCMGLVKAYDAFDPARGVCFSTYAVPVILGENITASSAAPSPPFPNWPRSWGRAWRTSRWPYRLPSPPSA